MPVEKIACTFQVVLDDGRTLRVVADQRDYARLEAAECDTPALQVGRAHGRARYLAWSVLKRTGGYSGTWEAFNERDAVDVQVADEPDGEDEQSVDPGRQAVGDGS